MINGIEYIAFLKIGKKENLIKLQNGNLYMKESKYYKNLEEEQGILGQGDIYDSCIIQRGGDLRINGIKVPEPDVMTLTTEKDEKTPIFCCSYLKKDDFIYDSPSKKYLLDKTKFDIECLKKEFGDYALIIAYPLIFLHRIKDYCVLKNIDFRFKEVQYIDYESKDNYWHQYYKNDLSHFFLKRKELSYQKEFRLLLANVFTEKRKDYFSIDIPDGFKDLTMLVPIEDIARLEYIPA